MFDLKAGVKRRTSHEPNRMLMRENKGFSSFAFDSAHVKYGVWPGPKACSKRRATTMPNSNEFGSAVVRQ